MSNSEMRPVVVDKGNTVEKNYESAKSRAQSVNSGFDVAGKPGSIDSLRKENASNRAEANIRMDVAGMEHHIQQIQKSISNLKKETKNLDKLKAKSSGADWKTLNKDAYELLIDAEKKYFEQTGQLLDKLNAHVNFHFREMVEADKKLSKYLSN